MARGDGVIPIIGETYQNVAMMRDVLEKSHKSWLELVRGEVDSNKINYNQTSQPHIKRSYIGRCQTTQALGIPAKSDVKPAATKPGVYERWYYLDDKFALIKVPGTGA